MRLCVNNSPRMGCPRLPRRTMRFDPEAGPGSARQTLEQQEAGSAGRGGPTGAGAYSGCAGPSAAYAGAAGGYHGAGYPGPHGSYGHPPGYGNSSPVGGYTSAHGAERGYGGVGGAGAAGMPPPAAVNLKDCSGADLLEHLPKVQSLMLRTLACVPEGEAAKNPLCLVSRCFSPCAGQVLCCMCGLCPAACHIDAN